MKTDTLIVGQGIAGSLVAFMLHLRQVPFLVVDPGKAISASRIAAGMFTPISGKRKTVHPMVPEQIPFAIATYKAISRLLDVNILHLQNIYEAHHSIAEQSAFAAKISDNIIGKYIQAPPDILNNIKQEFGAIEITDSGWVDCALWISHFRNWLAANHLLVPSTFVYDDLYIRKASMEYHETSFNHIIFCEGYEACANPFFPGEKIVPCKGDMLTIQSEFDSAGRIVKRNGNYLVAYGHQIYRSGATYHWNDDSLCPEAAGRKLIEAKLNAMLENEYKVVDHQSAIRPTTQSREVIAKKHAVNAGMFMLNGLGTKGILQGPWFARQVVSLIPENSG